MPDMYVQKMPNLNLNSVQQQKPVMALVGKTLVNLNNVTAISPNYGNKGLNILGKGGSISDYSATENDIKKLQQNTRIEYIG